MAAFKFNAVSNDVSSFTFKKNAMHFSDVFYMLIKWTLSGFFSK